MKTVGSAGRIGLCLWSINGACTAAQTVELGAGEAGVQHVQVGDELVLRLFSNPSTGVHWRIDAAAAQATLQTLASGRLIDPPPRRMVGSGGRYEWRFRAIAPGEATLRLERIDARSAAGAPAPERVFSVVVSPAGPP